MKQLFHEISTSFLYSLFWTMRQCKRALAKYSYIFRMRETDVLLVHSFLSTLFLIVHWCCLSNRAIQRPKLVVNLTPDTICFPPVHKINYKNSIRIDYCCFCIFHLWRLGELYYTSFIEAMSQTF